MQASSMIVLSITPRRRLVVAVRFSTRSLVIAHGIKDLFLAAWKNGFLGMSRTTALSCVLSYTISAPCPLSTPPVYNLLSTLVSSWINMQIAKSNIILPPFSIHGLNGLSWRVDLGPGNLHIVWLKLLPSFRSPTLRIRGHTARKNFNGGAVRPRMLNLVSISSPSPKRERGLLRHSHSIQIFRPCWRPTILSFIWIWRTL